LSGEILKTLKRGSELTKAPSWQFKL
jgi:hypothetical protein